MSRLIAKREEHIEDCALFGSVRSQADEPSDTVTQGQQNPVLERLSVRLELLDDSDLEYHAMLMELQELHEFCAAKARDAASAHQNVILHARLMHRAVLRFCIHALFRNALLG